MDSRFPNGLSAKLAQGVRVNTDRAKGAAALGRGPNKGVQLKSAPWSGTWPAPGATLDLDFANDRGFVRGVGSGRSMDAVTFTRGSNGTFVGSDGKLAGSGGNQGALGLNLLTFPQDFDTGWSKINATVTANTTTAPDGTNAADAIFETAFTGVHGVAVFPTLTVGSTYTFSAYAKANGRNYFLIAFGGLSGKYFDITPGTAGAVLGNMTGTATIGYIESVGNDWFRCSIVVPAASSAPQLSLYASTNGTSQTYLGDVTKGIFLWGAQLELGSTATTYYPTNINTPRFDWASTATVAQVNLLRYTEQFDNSYWTKTQLLAFGSGSIADTTETTAPDGSYTSDKIVENTAASQSHNIYGLSSGNTASVSYTFSVYIKKAGRDKCQLYGYNLTTAICTFDLTAGTTSSGSGTGFISAAISALANNWYRCSITFTNPATDVYAGLIFLNAAGQSTYTGDGTSGYYIWGAQLERGTAATTYLQVGGYAATNTPLAAASTCNGLLIEESRTNRILWCRDGTQSNWTKTNVTAAKDQTGIDGVANAATKLTASADGGTCIQTIALASGSRTGSVYLKRITGTGNVQVSLDGSTWSTVELSSTEWRRIVLSGTVTNPVVGIRIATSGDAVAMDYAQVEDGAYPTTPILTTSATATRSQDTTTLSGSNFLSLYNFDVGTVGFKGTLLNNYGPNQNFPISFYSQRLGGGSHYLQWQITNTSATSYGFNLSSGVSTSYGVPVSLAASYSFTGKPSISSTASSSVIQASPAITGNRYALDSLELGLARANVMGLNGYISRIIYFPQWVSEDASKAIARSL